MKLNLQNAISWSGHRSGWKYVVDILKRYHCQDGILTDGFVDATFGFMNEKNLSNRIIPYEKEWIGFWHHPVNISPWLNVENLAPAKIIDKTAFQQSLPYCQGIFTFSDYLSNYLKNKLQVPIETLFHPTEIPNLKFNYKDFLQQRRIIQVGSWLRRLTSFYRFKAPKMKKVHLLGKTGIKYFQLEIEFYQHDEFYQDNDFYVDDIELLTYCSDTEYDQLLSNSLVFIDLYDSSVNNTVIECMARNTPLVVNKIPAVVEYLGDDYPLYYQCIDEVPAIVQDLDLIQDAHEYLKGHQLKVKLSGDYFLQSFLNSNILNINVHTI